MLPRNLLSYELQGDVIVPRYLTHGDERWLGALIDELDALVGRTLGDVDGILADRLPRLASDHAVAPAVAAAVRHILEKSWRVEIKAAAPPAEIRRVVFELAADAAVPRDEVLGRAAATLGIRTEEVTEGLFADWRSERRLCAPRSEPSLEEVIDQYNLALVQGLLLRLDRIVARIRTHPGVVVRAAKDRGLLCSYSVEPTETQIVVSGPLALERRSLQYGLALAKFLPVLVQTPDWSFDAICLLNGRTARFHADASDPISAIRALPPEPRDLVESNLLESRLAKNFRRLGSRWSIHRETAHLDVGDGALFPDFKLEADERRVYVEVLGFYTPDHLESKLRGLRQARLSNVLVCLDESLACADGDIEADEVVRFRKHLDPKLLLEAANRYVSTPTPDHDTDEKRS